MAIDITLKIDGVNGESKVKNHEGEIDVLVLELGYVAIRFDACRRWRRDWQGEHTGRIDNQIYRQSLNESHT